ncbi:hypothetical protein UFOVP221_22 [uncultured Caudovirales phage]|uniref:Uncharacterized protein n=1 Tax=uncultured Caudovirales phage TaxID=2100421 RepID=A0A6J7WMJ1_9CAUD|nr:hypothetical protein UFOVP221_22 [uncultured Caudovirales phage]
MQTFITSTNGRYAFATTAHQLDNKRLNKQALEAWQIMMTNLKLDPEGNHREPKGWYNHPATKMWRGHEVVLCQYIDWMCEEWRERGYKTTIDVKANATLKVAIDRGLVSPTPVAPPWLEDSVRAEALASSHRTALLCKNYEWYSQFDWAEDTGTCPEGYEYVWGAE